MNIVGFQSSSLIEWENHISSIIWVGGCNWKCVYCHNYKLLTKYENVIDEKTIFDYLEKMSDWVDGLCITGGEPTLQSDLCDFIKRVKSKFDIKIKLSTNGSRSHIIKELLDNKLIDCLSIDLKIYPFERLSEIGGVNDNVLSSFLISFNCDVDVEYHTTLCPNFVNINTIYHMGEFLNNHGLWILQQYDKNNVLDINSSGIYEYNKNELDDLCKTAKSVHNNVIIR